MTDAAQRIQQSIGVFRPEQDSRKAIQSPESSDFKEILSTEKSKLDEVKFTAHAKSRIQERNIVMNTEQTLRLREAMNRIAEKGGRESLVVMDNIAFIVNAANKTIITAMASEQLKNNVFTNIDSAVFAS